MEPIEYIERLRMNQENYNFSRQDFITLLEKDMLETLEKNKTETGYLSYDKFRSVISDLRVKFNQISLIKMGSPLSTELWGFFFATKVIPFRKKLYPKEHEVIEKNRSSQTPAYVRAKKVLDKTYGIRN